MLDTTGLHERTFEIPSLTNARNYTFLCNMDTNVSRWSKNAVETFSLPGEYIFDAGKIWEEKIHPEDLPVYMSAFRAIWERRVLEQDFEYRVRNKDGKYVLCTCKSIVLPGNGETPTLFTGTIVNHGIARHIDPITSLHTKEEFRLKLRQYIKENAKACVMQIGINVFSHYNMLYGYKFGDKILLQFSEVLRHLMVSKGHVYRLDGAKFALAMRNMTDEVEAYRIYEAVRHVAETGLVVDGTSVPLKISGSAMFLNGQYGEDVSDVSIKSALAFAFEEARSEAHGGLIFIKEKNEAQATNLELVGAIHKSILDGCKGFYLCYQPLVDVRTERIVGAEALLRWHSDRYGEVPPGRFIPLLETDPAFYDLGNWIIKTALADMQKIKAKYPDFILNVNIAALQLERREFREEVVRMIAEAGFPAKDLFMEMTERCRDLDYAFLREQMEFFHANGIKLSLDDFGTGSSSLSLLRELPIDELKIDMSFIRDVETNEKNQTLVKNIVQTAKDMGLKTCLEGVETKSISNFLRHHDATYYQGYYYSKPVKADAFELMLEDAEKGLHPVIRGGQSLI